MIRTLDQARKEDLMTYYKCHCEYCNGDFVVSIEDLRESEAQFGMPKVANDEYVCKCPTCGHPNTGKNKDLTPCYQNGLNNIIFELNEKESQESRDFIKDHRHREEYMAEGKMGFSTTGGGFTYEITPTGLGPCIEIKCNKCGATKELTDSDSW